MSCALELYRRPRLPLASAVGVLKKPQNVGPLINGPLGDLTFYPVLLPSILGTVGSLKGSYRVAFDSQAFDTCSRTVVEVAVLNGWDLAQSMLQRKGSRDDLMSFSKR